MMSCPRCNNPLFTEGPDRYCLVCGYRESFYNYNGNMKLMAAYIDYQAFLNWEMRQPVGQALHFL